MASVFADRTAGITTSLAIKAPVVVATTEDITLSGEQTIDGVAVVADDRVLVKDQTDASENGIYVVKTSTWRRAKDCDGARDLTQGTLVKVISGTVGIGTYELSTSGLITVGTTELTFQRTANILMGESTVTLSGVAALYGSDWSEYDYADLLAYESGGSVGASKLSFPKDEKKI